MAKIATTHVILLRAIGPLTHRLMTMTQWRDASEKAGFSNVETLVNTGNMIADFAGDAKAVAAATVTVLRGFGLGENVVPIVRSPHFMHQLLAARSIATASGNPSETAVFFCADPQSDYAWLDRYEGPETIQLVEDHLVVDFSPVAGKVGPLIRQIDKHCGINTARNLNSVRRIAERCAARENN
jgi:uncharacterized protein (DUF1697 family)